MLKLLTVTATATALGLASSALAQQKFGTWCGKYYQVGAPIPNSRPEGSLFPYPEKSSQPLLDFRCATASSLYLQGDNGDPPRVLVDTNITYDVGQAYHGDWSGKAQVSIYTDDWNPLTNGTVPLNTLATYLPFELTSLQPRMKPYTLICKAEIDGQTFWTNNTLSYLPPNPYGGNTVKIDRGSGALLVRNETAQDATWEKIIPFGFYDSQNSNSGFNTSQTTLDRLYEAKRYGFNFVHTVPAFSNYTPYGAVGSDIWNGYQHYLDVAEELGIWIMYDMRYTYTNLSSVEEQVKAFRNRSNILLWYTGDEGDGAGDALNISSLAYERIYSLDSYHPVSLVLNCENYYFIEYGLSGTDILMVDPYPIALNGAWSKRYGTPVNENYGDSGCDNCNGTMYDITERIESSRDRTRLQGKYRTIPTWMVPQSFDDGQQEFWWRVPTGDEESVQTVLAFNHGAMGHCAWNSQYSTYDILNNASAIANNLYGLSDFVVDAYDSRKAVYGNASYPGINNYDFAAWSRNTTNGTETLVMGVNFNYIPSDQFTTIELANVTGTVKQVVFGNVTTGAGGKPIFHMGRTSVHGVILQS